MVFVSFFFLNIKITFQYTIKKYITAGIIIIIILWFVSCMMSTKPIEEIAAASLLPTGTRLKAHYLTAHGTRLKAHYLTAHGTRLKAQYLTAH